MTKKIVTILAQQMYEALKGKYLQRERQVSNYRLINDRGEEDIQTEKKPAHIIRFNKYYPDWSDHSKSMKLDRNELEAMLLIPEDHRLVEVERVSAGYENAGFYIPKYTEEALQALFDAYSKHFADEGDLYDKEWILRSLYYLLPDEIKRFGQHRNQIVAGIKNSYFCRKENTIGTPDAEIHNIAKTLMKIGLNHASDQEFIAAYWEKAKENPNGYMPKEAWALIADYIMENNPQLVLEFDVLRKGVAQESLAGLLALVPYSEAAESVRGKRRMFTPEVSKPILEAIERTIYG